MSPDNLAQALTQETDLVYLRQLAVQQAYEIERQANAIKQLQAEIERLEARLAALDPEAQAEEIRQVKELLAHYQQKIFGRSTERRVPPDKPAANKEKQPPRGHPRRDQSRLRQQTEVHEARPEDKRCPHCQGELIPLGNEAEETTLIDVISREFVQVLHRRLKYRCRCNGYVYTAPGPLTLQPGSLYTPGFAVEVVIGKYQAHLPLERQARLMKQEGLIIDSQTLWDQINRLASIVAPTYEAILAEILKQPLVLADETRWPLLANGRLKENQTCYAWCVVGGDLVGYRILDERSQEAGHQMLADYLGTVMADGYAVYQALARPPQPEQAPRFKLAHCWSHVRRKFVEAEGNHPECTVVLDMLKDLFLIERELKDLAPAARLPQRQERSQPLVDAVFAWAQAQHPLPRSSLAKAIAYMQELEPGLRLFLEDPLVPLSNNECERLQRGLVLGRKNHHGSRSRRGTQVAAIFYTLVESAQQSGVDVRAYLKALTEKSLLQPGSVLLPAHFKQQPGFP